MKFIVNTGRCFGMWPALLVTTCLVLLFPACVETPLDDTSTLDVTGTVVDADTGEPLEGALIELNPTLQSRLTGADGRFEINDVTTGEESLTLNVTLEGYRRFIQSISPTAVSGSVNLIVELEFDVAVNRAPSRPSNPMPANGAVGQQRAVQLSWESEDRDGDELSFDVILGSATGLQRVATGISDTTFLLSGLDAGEAYTWQVAVTDSRADTVFGPVWRFEVAAAPPAALAFTRIIGDDPGIFATPVGATGEESIFRITPEGVSAFRPVFSPTGEQVAYLRFQGTEIYLWAANSDGSNPRRLYSLPLIDIYAEQYSFAWTPDGTRVVFGVQDRVIGIDVETRFTSNIFTLGDRRRVMEVDVHPDGGRYAVNAVSQDGLITDVLVVNPLVGSVDTIMADTTGLVTGGRFSPSGNELLLSVDMSGSEFASRRQLDAQVFEFDLVRGTRRAVNSEKPEGVNDLNAVYSGDGGSIFFTRASNVLGRIGDVYRTSDLNDASSAELFVERATHPSAP